MDSQASGPAEPVPGLFIHTQHREAEPVVLILHKTEAQTGEVTCSKPPSKMTKRRLQTEAFHPSAAMPHFLTADILRFCPKMCHQKMANGYLKAKTTSAGRRATHSLFQGRPRCSARATGQQTASSSRPVSGSGFELRSRPHISRWNREAHGWTMAGAGFRVCCPGTPWAPAPQRPLPRPCHLSRWRPHPPSPSIPCGGGGHVMGHVTRSAQ